jgi:hypothetical protein
VTQHATAYLERAAQLRQIARDLADDRARAILLATATDYERMARGEDTTPNAGPGGAPS